MSGKLDEEQEAGIVATSRWSARVIGRHEGQTPGDRCWTVLRLIPSLAVKREKWWERTSPGDAKRQLRAATQALRTAGLNAQRCVALAPSGWLAGRWPGSNEGTPPDQRSAWAFGEDATPFLDGLQKRIGGQIGAALAAFPARYVVFGVDYWPKEGHWFFQGMFVFDKRKSRVAHGTSKYVNPGNWKNQLFASKDWSRRCVDLDGLGRVLLLNCHDLASLVQRRVPRHKLNKELRAYHGRTEKLIKERKPQGLLHIAHTLGGHGLWKSKLAAFERQYGIRYAGSTGRYQRWRWRGKKERVCYENRPVEDYLGVVRGWNELSILLKPTGGK